MAKVEIIVYDEAPSKKDNRIRIETYCSNEVFAKCGVDRYFGDGDGTEINISAVKIARLVYDAVRENSQSAVRVWS